MAGGMRGGGVHGRGCPWCWGRKILNFMCSQAVGMQKCAVPFVLLQVLADEQRAARSRQMADQCESAETRASQKVIIHGR